jgi:hypothetical protein
MNPFTIVLIITAILNGLNIWYIVSSRRLHDISVKKRKENKKK